jgi:hypothetical protein
VRAPFFQLERIIAAFCLATACSAAGCAHWPFYMGPDLRQAPQQAAEVDITYRLDASRLNIPVAVARIEGQLVSYDDVAGSVSPDRTVGSLRIIYPSADAPTGYARIEVQVDAAPLPKMPQLDDPAKGSASWYERLSSPRELPAAASHETWAMNLPKAELDRLLGLLSTPGSVMAGKQAQTAGAMLTTHFNGHHYRGACRPVPQLDALMRKVRDQGRLVAYTHPLSSNAQPLERFSSVAMFRDQPGQDSNVPNDPSMEKGPPQLATTSGLAAPNASRVVYLPAGPDSTIRR